MFKNYRDVEEWIDSEGRDDFLLHKSKPNDMPCEEGKKLFRKAKKALDAFETFVLNKSSSEPYEGDADED